MNSDGLEDENDRTSNDEGLQNQEEDWSGFGRHQVQHLDEPTRPKKTPNGVELREIRDATDLYRSSSFKLQVHSSSFQAMGNLFISYQD